MIIESKTLELNQKRLIEHFKVKGRFKKFDVLTNVACFVFWLNGRNILYTADNQIVSKGRDALLLKCGTYINELLPQKGEVIELVVVHLYPDILRDLFQHDMPETLTQILVAKPLPVKLEHHDLLEEYVDSLLLYFEHQEIVDKDMLNLKLKELILLLSKTQQRQTLGQILEHLFSREKVSFTEVIEAQLFNKLSIKELAYLTNRSVASFKRDFEKFYKSSPAFYITNKRLERAAQLILSSSRW